MTSGVTDVVLLSFCSSRAQLLQLTFPLTCQRDTRPSSLGLKSSQLFSAQGPIYLLLHVEPQCWEEQGCIQDPEVQPGIWNCTPLPKAQLRPQGEREAAPTKACPGIPAPTSKYVVRIKVTKGSMAVVSFPPFLVVSS